MENNLTQPKKNYSTLGNCYSNTAKTAKTCRQTPAAWPFPTPNFYSAKKHAASVCSLKCSSQNSA